MSYYYTEMVTIKELYPEVLEPLKYDSLADVYFSCSIEDYVKELGLVKEQELELIQILKKENQWKRLFKKEKHPLCFPYNHLKS